MYTHTWCTITSQVTCTASAAALLSTCDSFRYVLINSEASRIYKTRWNILSLIRFDRKTRSSKEVLVVQAVTMPGCCSLARRLYTSSSRSASNGNHTCKLGRSINGWTAVAADAVASNKAVHSTAAVGRWWLYASRSRGCRPRLAAAAA